jgi:hypothetical protein
MKEVETPDAAAVGDRAPVQTGLEQLQLGDHPMLPVSSLVDAQFVTHHG